VLPVRHAALPFSCCGQIDDIQPIPKGVGVTCDVFVGYWRVGQKQVAIKKLRVFLSKKEDTAKTLAKEMKIWSALQHRNVLPLLGFFIQGGEFPNFISEWMVNGSLFDYLKIFSGGIESFSMISGIASGLTYLHKHGVIHADLKSPNVLISAAKEPLLADFGISQVLYPLFSTVGQSNNSDSLKGTVRWMARELLAESDHDELLSATTSTPIIPNEKSDVWAFGMVFYEILSRKVPFSELTSVPRVLLAISKGKLPSRVDLSKDPVLALYEDDLWKLCNRCWDLASNRPGIGDVEASIATLAKEAEEQFAPSCDNSFMVKSVTEIPQTLKRGGEDWSAVFNPTAENITDVCDIGKLQCQSQVCCVRFSPTGKIVAIACVASTQVVDIIENKLICTFTQSQLRYVSDMCFSPDGKYLAAAVEYLQMRKTISAPPPRKGICFVWSMETEQVVQVFEGHQREINALAFFKDSRNIATGSSDCTARLWDIGDGQVSLFRVTDAVGEDVDAGISSIALSPEDDLLAAGCFDNVIRLWNTNTGDLVGRLCGHTDAVYSVTFSIDGRRLFSGGLDNSLKCWNIVSLMKSPSERFRAARGKTDAPSLPRDEREPFCRFTRSGHEGDVLGLAQSVCGRWIASCSLDKSIIFWDSRDGHAQFVINIGYPVKSFALTNGTHGGLLVAISGENQARLWTFSFK